jgi:hypothetical protein
MNDDTRRLVYGTIIAFLVFITAWLGFVYISACGFTLNCIQGAPLIVRTPVPTLIPHGEIELQTGMTEGEFNQCRIAATDLVAAWVLAGRSESEPFSFTDLDGQDCEGTYEDVQILFRENSLWYPGSQGCTSCHNADLAERSNGLDLSTYEAISLGTRRVAGSTSPGTDLFGRGEWENSILYNVLYNQGLTPEGHSPDVPPNHPVIYAGQSVGEEPVTPTPTP